MRQELEKSLYDIRPVKEDLLVYQVGNLESLSASALYTGDLPPMGPGGLGRGGFGNGGGPKFKDYPMFGVLKTPSVGTSNFKVQLPKSNAIDKGIKISTPNEAVVINPYKRIEGNSGIDYFNLLDNSLAGRIKGLNHSEISYLKDLGKKD